MNRRDILSIIIKVFGLQLVIQAIAIVPQIISAVSSLASEALSEGQIVSVFITTIITALIYIVAAYIFLFNTEKVLNWMLGDEVCDPNEFSNLRIHRSTILSISVIVIGGLLMIDSLPGLFYYIYYSLTRPDHDTSGRTFLYIIFNAAKIFIGIVMMAYQKVIVLWIDKRRRT